MRAITVRFFVVPLGSSWDAVLDGRRERAAARAGKGLGGMGLSGKVRKKSKQQMFLERAASAAFAARALLMPVRARCLPPAAVVQFDSCLAEEISPIYLANLTNRCLFSSSVRLCARAVRVSLARWR